MPLQQYTSSALTIDETGLSHLVDEGVKQYEGTPETVLPKVMVNQRDGSHGRNHSRKIQETDESQATVAAEGARGMQQKKSQKSIIQNKYKQFAENFKRKKYSVP